MSIHPTHMDIPGKLEVNSHHLEREHPITAFIFCRLIWNTQLSGIGSLQKIMCFLYNTYMQGVVQQENNMLFIVYLQT